MAKTTDTATPAPAKPQRLRLVDDGDLIVV